MASELLPCPFCGNEVTFRQVLTDSRLPYMIHCDHCQRANSSRAFDTAEQAAADWNTRTPSEAAIIRAFVERVEKRFHDEAIAKTYLQCARDELAALEAEVKE